MKRKRKPTAPAKPRRVAPDADFASWLQYQVCHPFADMSAEDVAYGLFLDPEMVNDARRKGTLIMATPPRTPRHGGKRKNAGRKANVKRAHAVSVMLSEGETEWLDAVAHRLNTSRAEALRAALAAYIPEGC